MSKTKLSVTIDKELKNEAKKILDDIGLDYSTAISIFFTQIVKKKKIPFELSQKKMYSPEKIFGKDWHEKVHDIKDEWS